MRNKQHPNKVRPSKLFSACVCALGISGLAAYSWSQSGTLPAPADPATGMQKTDAMYQNDRAEGTLTNEKFVEQAALGGLTEVEASQLALQRSQDTQIRAFAERMVRDHNAANAELKNLAASKKIKAPEQLDVMHKSTLSALKLSPDEKFDGAYAEQMRKDHDKTVALFELAQKSTALDDGLRNFAAKTLAILHEHQKNAAGLVKSASSR